MPDDVDSRLRVRGRWRGNRRRRGLQEAIALRDRA
jgi:hypothetical protein